MLDLQNRHGHSIHGRGLVGKILVYRSSSKQNLCFFTWQNCSIACCASCTPAGRLSSEAPLLAVVSVCLQLPPCDVSGVQPGTSADSGSWAGRWTTASLGSCARVGSCQSVCVVIAASLSPLSSAPAPLPSAVTRLMPFSDRLTACAGAEAEDGSRPTADGLACFPVPAATHST